MVAPMRGVPEPTSPQKRGWRVFPIQKATTFDMLSSAAREVMGQLFLFGPAWDGAVASKMGRGELRNLGLAYHVNGWAFLTVAGVAMAVSADVSSWADPRWRNKQRCL